jgi:hypothetical protein
MVKTMLEKIAEEDFQWPTDQFSQNICHPNGDLMFSCNATLLLVWRASDSSHDVNTAGLFRMFAERMFQAIDLPIIFPAIRSQDVAASDLTAGICCRVVSVDGQMSSDSLLMFAVQDRSDEVLDLVRIGAAHDLISVLPQFKDMPSICLGQSYSPAPSP